MKQLFITITLILLSFTAYAQDTSSEATYPKLPTLNLQMAAAFYSTDTMLPKSVKRKVDLINLEC